MTKARIFAGLFIAANVVDLAVTLLILGQGGTELNPVMGFVFDQGVFPALAWKIALPAAIAAVLLWRRRLAVLGILAAGFVGICVWNITSLVIS